MEIEWLVTGCLLNNEKILDDKGKVKLHNSAPNVPTIGAFWFGSSRALFLFRFNCKT